LIVFFAMRNVSGIIRKFNRFELKYLLTSEQAAHFENKIQGYLHPDTYGRGGKYRLSSLYYDSSKYHFYWEKIEGIKFRRKLRIRHYESSEPLTDQTKVFVEIKQRLDRVTQKRRLRLAYQDALELCSGKSIPEILLPEERSIAEEIHEMVLRYNLEPTSVVSYFRKAYLGTDYDEGLRVTFDTDLHYRTHDLDLRSKAKGESLLALHHVIMEIKVNERVPYWLTEFVGESNLKLIRVSKYCQSLEVSEKVPSSRFFISL